MVEWEGTAEELLRYIMAAWERSYIGSDEERQTLEHRALAVLVADPVQPAKGSGHEKIK